MIVGIGCPISSKIHIPEGVPTNSTVGSFFINNTWNLPHDIWLAVPNVARDIRSVTIAENSKFCRNTISLFLLVVVSVWLQGKTYNIFLYTAILLTRYGLD